MDAKETTQKTETATRKENLSLDRKWRSFPKVPGLLQYVSTGTYFARTRMGGKLIRQSLETPVFSIAKLRLADFIKGHQRRKSADGTFGDARKQYEAQTELDHSLAANTKRYRRYCLRILRESWPELDSLPLRRITEEHCREWASRVCPTLNPQYFNNTLGTFRAVFDLGGLTGSDNPARKVKRIGVPTHGLVLPEPDQFRAILKQIKTAGARQSKDCADFVRFLAFSGCRLSEARSVTWADVDLKRGIIGVTNSKRKRRSNKAERRDVPIIPEMAELLTKLHTEQNPKPEDKPCRVGECQKSLTRACKLVGIPRLTHHDLRHLFGTRCVESSVDIGTVADWMGHSDGGALLLKTYRHLRRNHSLEMAKKVKF